MEASAKYLGIILDYKLTRHEHINRILEKAKRTMNLLKYTAKRKWRADPDINLLFYKSYVWPILDYGSIFYGSATNSRLVKIDRIQYKAKRLVKGAYRSTPTTSLLTECNETPLNNRREILASKYLLNILSYSFNTLTKKINSASTHNLTSSY